jgi:hypothetical protein
MKIRNGFVSNSSSSSFCIMGVTTSESELLPLYLKAMGKDASATIEPGCSCDIDRDAMKEQGYSFCPKCQSKLFVEIEPDEELYEMCEALDLDYASEEYGDAYVGISLKSGKNVEGVIEELRKAEKKLKELFGDDADIRVHSGVTYG